MAAGDVTVFNRFTELLGGEGAIHDLGADTFKMGIITNTTPLQTAVEPRWIASGNPDFSALETLATGGNYTAEGEPLSTTITDNWSITGAVSTFAGDNISILTHASNPTGTTTSSAYWGIIYNSTSVTKECVAFVDLGGPVDMTLGDFTITWDGAGGAANAIFTLTN